MQTVTKIGRKTKIKTNTASDRIFYTVVNIIMLIMLMLVILPIMNVISSSISDPTMVLQGRVALFPKGFSLEGYKAVLSNSDILTGYTNTILYTAATAFLGVVVTILAAYPLSRKDLVGRNSIMVLFTITMLFSGGIIPTYLLMRDLNLIDSRWSIILPGMLNTYNIIVARTFFQSTIPDELLEAAKIDGCGNFRFLFSIVLPVSKAIIAVLALYFGVAAWNAWFSAYLYINDSTKLPLQLVLKEILFANSRELGASAGSGEEGAKMDALAESIKYAAIMVSYIPVWCAYPFVQKHFVKGVMIGAVKG